MRYTKWRVKTVETVETLDALEAIIQWVESRYKNTTRYGEQILSVDHYQLDLLHKEREREREKPI